MAEDCCSTRKHSSAGMSVRLTRERSGVRAPLLPFFVAIFGCYFVQFVLRLFEVGVGGVWEAKMSLPYPWSWLEEGMRGKNEPLIPRKLARGGYEKQNWAFHTLEAGLRRVWETKMVLLYPGSWLEEGMRDKNESSIPRKLAWGGYERQKWVFHTPAKKLVLEEHNRNWIMQKAFGN